MQRLVAARDDCCAGQLGFVYHMPLFFECWNVIKLNKDVPIFSDVLILASARNHWIDANEYPAFFVVPIKAAAEVAQFVHPPFARLGRALI